MGGFADELLALAAKKVADYNSRKGRGILRRLQLRNMALKAHALKKLVAVAGEKPAERDARPAACEASGDSGFGEQSAGNAVHPSSPDAAAVQCSCRHSSEGTQVPRNRKKCPAHSELDDTPELSRCDGGPPGPSAPRPDVSHEGDGASDGDHPLCQPGALDDEYPVEGAPFPSWLYEDNLAEDEPLVEPDLGFLDDDQL
ncbi:hypothetical protein V5799_027443 [Amblyomma americanum]|uniref:Uncharacterized protein n=1 Tax=Amblyomma americanum TaxID=6943 RepID=A0AAQ4DFQ1_AMBAM